MANPPDVPPQFLPYTLEEMMDPQGNNTLGSREAFMERKMYKEVPYFGTLPAPIRSWYDKLYFGRVDMIQNAIVVKRDTSHLKQIKTATGNIFVLDFVADAFRDLRTNMRRAADANFISSNSVYARLEAVTGLEDYDNSRDLIKEDWKRRFAARLNSSPRLSNSVVDLRTYIVELLHYLNSPATELPLTLTGYVVSNQSSPMISGLSIELQTNNYAQDPIKFTKYLTDINFGYFVRAARKYGFYVDRNGPWKITADPLSSPMLGYMSQYLTVSPTFPGVSFFNHYYERTYVDDLERLKKTLQELYNDYVTRFPRMRIETESTTDCFTSAQEEVAYRHPVTLEQVNALGDRYWLDLYFKIRLREAQLVMSDYNFKYRTATSLLDTYTMERALRYINNEIKPYLYDKSLGKNVLTRPQESVRIGTVNDTQPGQQGETPSAPGTATTGPTGGTGGSSY